MLGYSGIRSSTAPPNLPAISIPNSWATEPSIVSTLSTGPGRDWDPSQQEVEEDILKLALGNGVARHPPDTVPPFQLQAALQPNNTVKEPEKYVITSKKSLWFTPRFNITKMHIISLV